MKTKHLHLFAWLVAVAALAAWAAGVLTPFNTKVTLTGTNTVTGTWTAGPQVATISGTYQINSILFAVLPACTASTDLTTIVVTPAANTVNPVGGAYSLIAPGTYLNTNGAALIVTNAVSNQWEMLASAALSITTNAATYSTNTVTITTNVNSVVLSGGYSSIPSGIYTRDLTTGLYWGTNGLSYIAPGSTGWTLRASASATTTNTFISITNFPVTWQSGAGQTNSAPTGIYSIATNSSLATLGVTLSLSGDSTNAPNGFYAVQDAAALRFMSPTNNSSYIAYNTSAATWYLFPRRYGKPAVFASTNFPAVWYATGVEVQTAPTGALNYASAVITTNTTYTTNNTALFKTTASAPTGSWTAVNGNTNAIPTAGYYTNGFTNAFTAYSVPALNPTATNTLGSLTVSAANGYTLLLTNTLYVGDKIIINGTGYFRNTSAYIFGTEQ